LAPDLSALAPRSGLERSDFVPWPIASGGYDTAIGPEREFKQTCQRKQRTAVSGVHL